jgi:hypothetical protein
MEYTTALRRSRSNCPSSSRLRAVMYLRSRPFVDGERACRSVQR